MNIEILRVLRVDAAVWWRHKDPRRSGELAFDPNIGFVHPPRSRCGALPAMCFVSDGTCVFFDPTVERCMICRDAPLGHDIFEIAIRDAKPNVDVHRIEDHRLRVMCAFETDQFSNPGHRSPKRILWTCPHPNAMTHPKVCDTTLGNTNASICCRAVSVG